MKNTNHIDNAGRFRQLMGRYTTGVSVLLARHEGDVVGLTANSLTSVSLDPLLLLFCTRRQSANAARLIQAGQFTVNLLGEHQQGVSRHFANSMRDEPSFDIAGDDAHVWLPDSNAVFKCRIAQVHKGGDHHIVVGEVLDLIGPDIPVPPLVYHGGSYARLA